MAQFWFQAISENKTCDLWREHFGPLFSLWIQCSLQNKMKWLFIGNFLSLLLLIARSFEMYGANFLQFIPYRIRKVLLCLFRKIGLIEDNSGKYSIKVNEKMEVMWTVQDYSDHKTSIREMELKEKLLTAVVNNLDIMTLGKELLMDIARINGNINIEMKGSSNWHLNYLRKIVDAFGERFNDITDRFNSGGGGDVDANLHKHSELDVDQMKRIAELVRDYLYNVCDKARDIGRITLDGDAPGTYYVLDGPITLDEDDEAVDDEDVEGEDASHQAEGYQGLPMRIIKSLFWSMSVVEYYESLPIGGFKIYTVKGLYFETQKGPFNLGRIKLRYKCFNENGEFMGYYHPELLDISCKCTGDGIHDKSELSDMICDNGLYWLAWNAFKAEVTRLKNEPRGDGLRQQRMEERERVCQQIEEMFGDFLRHYERNFDGELDEQSAHKLMAIINRIDDLYRLRVRD